MHPRCFSDDQLASFRRDGFVVIPGLFDAGAMREVTALTDEIQSLPELPDKSMMCFEDSLTEPGDAVVFDSFAPHRSAPNTTASPRRVLYVTCNRLSEGDHRVSDTTPTSAGATRRTSGASRAGSIGSGFEREESPERASIGRRATAVRCRQRMVVPAPDVASM